jgi:hypothetical protein
MKKIFFGICGILTMQSLIAQNVNFSGKWKINNAKSSFGAAPSFVVPIEINVVQERDSVYLNAVNIDDKNEQSTSSAKYAVNGKPVERMFQQNIKLVGSFNWSEDKTRLLKDQKYINIDQPDQPLRKVKETWSLSGDGKVLTILQNVEGSNYDQYSVTAIYEK